MKSPYRRNKEFFNFLCSSLKFDFGSVFGVFDGYQDVKFFSQVLPVGPASILIFLKKRAFLTDGKYIFQKKCRNCPLGCVFDDIVSIF